MSFFALRKNLSRVVISIQPDFLAFRSSGSDELTVKIASMNAGNPMRMR